MQAFDKGQLLVGAELFELGLQGGGHTGEFELAQLCEQCKNNSVPFSRPRSRSTE